MTIIFINGRELKLLWHELRGLLWHPLFVALLLTFTAVIIALGPYDGFMLLSTMEKTVFYANGVVTFMALLVGVIAVLNRLGRVVRSFAVLAVAVIGASVWGLWFGVLLGATPPHLVDYILVFSFNLTFALLGEIVLVSFLLGRILDDLGVSPKTAASAVPEAVAAVPAQLPPPQTIEVLGRRFLLGELWALTAEEHYVSVGILDGKTVLLRGTMSDAVAALPETLGVRVHRSHWVSRQAVAALVRSSKGWRVQLGCGAEVPVARSRQADLVHWLNTSGGGMEKGTPQGALRQP